MIVGACGKDKELENYNKEIALFNENVSGIVADMNQIDTSSDEAQADLLSCLDSMKTEFERLAELEVPSKFKSVESLADEASSYMTESVSLYHEVFEAEDVLEEKAEAANENYNRAMERISLISTLLKGEVPEGDQIQITEEESPDFTPVKED